MVGGGQLARMTHQAAIALGQGLRVLAARADDPAAQVSADVVLGEHTDLDALRAVAVGASVLTFDHEHVPQEHLATLVAEGVTVLPPPGALLHAQDKLVMRRRLSELGVPVPPFAVVRSVTDVHEFGDVHGWPCVLKAVRGGYDGRGVWVLDRDGVAEVVDAQLAAGTPLMVEQRVDFARELAAVVARSPFGQGAAWPVVQTVQRDGTCALVLAPAPDLHPDLAEAAEQLALRIAAELGVVGVLAVELFETRSSGSGPGRLVVNELAMRPHNSGHWSIEGARTSQFEQHLRAVLDYPLGDTSTTAPAVVMANVLGAPDAPVMTLDERAHHLFARLPEAKLHLYGKGERPGRKLGHVTVLGDEVTEVAERAERAAHWMSHAEWTDGWDPHA
ncbi:5-(carboxyamino)imidazole ribonucleotide synthase [Rhodococcus antarcticus]|uniref:N5-carboxyaminoimidazole ribonucleotide synthase n=1 Tax=Rhodococcus antarcticus TaxID=2987751 RepID=A0ABY6P4P3_9NOCA|nr:5-(carboxyamino)imidazole ribonucleotide synthase [Rhodococcus antarcticus]UZJ26493.1 5-(carboxyamino)imidazole ribonucleotide synthase [Rhodococcus antarcticus]